MKPNPASRSSACGSSVITFLLLLFGTMLLAAFIFDMSGNWEKEHLKKPKAIHDVTSLKKAIEAYHEDYGRLPDTGPGEGEYRTDGEAGANLLTILMGKEEEVEKATGGSLQNPRKIDYFLNYAGNKTGLVYVNEDRNCPAFLDPWGKPLVVKPGKAEGIEAPLRPGNIVHGEVALVYSHGPDGKPGTKDDVKTW